MTAEQFAKGLYSQVVAAFGRVGHSVEAIPGWGRVERFLDDIADGFAFGLALMWALRWYWLALGVGILIAGADA